MKYQDEYGWTVNPETHRANSSPLFNEIVKHVEEMIKESSFDLLHGRIESVASLIVAQIAHVHNLSPKGPEVNKKTIQTLIIASREYLHQNKMPDEYKKTLEAAIAEAYLFVTGNEWDGGK